jgi:hypothetical protein
MLLLCQCCGSHAWERMKFSLAAASGSSINISCSAAPPHGLVHGLDLDQGYSSAGSCSQDSIILYFAGPG